jgi:hypothetical protein
MPQWNPWALKPESFDREYKLLHNNPDHRDLPIWSVISNRVMLLTANLIKYIDLEGMKTHICMWAMDNRDPSQWSKFEQLVDSGQITIYIDDFLSSTIQPTWNYLHLNDTMDQDARRIECSERSTNEDQYEVRKKYYQAFRVIITNWLEEEQWLLVLPLRIEEIPWHKGGVLKPNYQKIEISRKPRI